MMRLSQNLAAVGLAFLTAASAHAGVNLVSPSLDLDTTVRRSAVPQPPQFTSLLSFQVPAASYVNVAVSNLPFGTGGALLNLALDSIAVVEPGNHLLGSASGSGVTFLSLASTTKLAANTPYELAVAGTLLGSIGGRYHATISLYDPPALAATPVPEPNVWAMMLAGVVLAGWQLRRRSNL